VQEGYGVVFATRVQVLIEDTRVAVQVWSEPEIYHGAGIKLRADERVRVQRHNEFVLSAGAKAKSVTKKLPILSELAIDYYL